MSTEPRPEEFSEEVDSESATAEAAPDGAAPESAAPDGAAPESAAPDSATPDSAAETAVPIEPEEGATEMPFVAEVQKVLTLVIDSLYANKEVFLRELVSNASDALDKGRFFQMTHEDARKQEGESRIDIVADEDARTLTISDNGVGMTRDEIIQNLGTIAKSGSLEFLKQAKADPKSKDQSLQLIGQFGVGFYSAFMVASRVDVDTLSMTAESEPVLWRSNGAGTFSVKRGSRTTPGTTLTLHLKDEHREFLRGWRLNEVIKRYSDFVGFPIFVGGEQANQVRALWAMPRAQVTNEQHKAFFTHLTGGSVGEEPLVTVHLSIDAPTQFFALLYIPEKAPFDLFQKERQGLKLYAKRVLIVESCEKLSPIYLRFLRGVVDSEDLSLNVSREMLQESRALTQIEQQATKQVLRALKDLSENDPDKYLKFWRVFGKVLKEGITVDFRNKDAILELCRFESMSTPDGQLLSLKQYLNAMPEEQKEIYFVTGPSRRALESSPHLEAFKKKGFDVLYLTDPIDEWVVQAIPDYEKRKLKSIVHGDIDLGVPEEGESTATEKAVSAIKAALGDRIKDVRLSKRLTDSPSCLVSDEGDPGANMERIMKMIDDRANEQKRILEINPNHAVVRDIATMASKRGEDDPTLKEYCEMLYDQALLAEGVVLDPAKLAKRLEGLLAQATKRSAEEPASS